MYVDAEGAVRDWVNSLTSLVGEGNPLLLGAHLDRLRSPARGCYAWLLRVGGTPELTAERPVDRARISASIYGLTKESAAAAAVAYANALLTLEGRRTPMGLDVVCLAVDSIAGPTAIDPSSVTEDRHRYLVDCDLLLAPASAL